jgi:hypothetical protein
MSYDNGSVLCVCSTTINSITETSASSVKRADLAVANSRKLMYVTTPNMSLRTSEAMLEREGRHICLYYKQSIYSMAPNQADR